eukprot:746272-Hanusia_phi.AAC.1
MYQSAPPQSPQSAPPIPGPGPPDRARRASASPGLIRSRTAMHGVPGPVSGYLTLTLAFAGPGITVPHLSPPAGKVGGHHHGRHTRAGPGAPRPSDRIRGPCH